MIRAMALWGVILSGLGPAGFCAAGPAATVHCAGLREFETYKTLATWQKAISQPESAPVGQLLVYRVADLAARGFTGSNAPDAASLFEPMVKDAALSEMFLQIGSAAWTAPGVVVAVKLDAAREALWRSNWTRLGAGAGEEFKSQGFTGIRWKGGASGEAWFVPAQSWVVAGWGKDSVEGRDLYLKEISSHGRPGPALKDAWLGGAFDTANLTAIAPDWLKLFRPARVLLTTAVEGSNLVTRARAVYHDPVNWKSLDWKIPEDLVPGHFNSFTAGRDVAAYLNLGPNFASLDANPLTNQFLMWALGGMPFVTYGVSPAAASKADLAKLGKEAAADFNATLKKFNGTELVWNTNNEKLLLANLRVFGPTLEYASTKSGNLMLLKGFPQIPLKDKLPEALRQEISNTNLIYYDWEATGSRLQDWQMLGRMLLEPHWGFFNGDVDRLLGALFPTWTGPTVTEVTRTGPDEVNVTRTSPSGLTGLEIFLLTQWLAREDGP